MRAANIERMMDQQDEDAPKVTGTQADRAEQFVGGAIRKSLGLSRDDVRLGLDLARSQLQRGRHAEAFRTYATMIILDPSDPELQIGFANCALAMKENSLALQAASAAIVLQPDDCRGYFLSGKACLALGLKEESKEDFTQALQLSAATNNKLVLNGAQKYLAIIEQMG